jgi:hypothetical protein
LFKSADSSYVKPIRIPPENVAVVETRYELPLTIWKFGGGVRSVAGVAVTDPVATTLSKVTEISERGIVAILVPVVTVAPAWAEHDAVLPPYSPVHVQYQGPTPVTAEAVEPMPQRLLAGMEENT